MLFHPLFSRFEALSSSLHLRFIPLEVPSPDWNCRAFAGSVIEASRGRWKERDLPVSTLGGSPGEAMIDSWVEFPKVVRESFERREGAEATDCCVAAIG